MMTAYTHGVLILSLGGQVTHDLIGSPNALVNGAVLSQVEETKSIGNLAPKRFLKGCVISRRDDWKIDHSVPPSFSFRSSVALIANSFDVRI
jgi:hypothetical protein